MKKTARVIVTFGCNRKCPGCCNSQLPEYRTIHSDEELMKYQEIVITGGEPMLIPGKVLEFINSMWDKGYRRGTEGRCICTLPSGMEKESVKKS